MPRIDEDIEDSIVLVNDMFSNLFDNKLHVSCMPMFGQRLFILSQILLNYTMLITGKLAILLGTQLSTVQWAILRHTY